ncbi:MAG: HEPN domain-containing protein [Desulfobacterales bacterium]|nr:HEPN domain-containing protein [Pseudomonadota bacterium]MCK4728555.1 HEPN domain-containing protein [Desulfobacterales bacterium]
MSRVELARYRMEKTEEFLEDAEDALERRRLMLAVNRAYYTMFTSAKALLALEEKDSSKHSGVISLFNQWIVKPGYFSREISRFFVKAKDLREDADYADFVKITEEDARIQVERASKFFEEAKKSLEEIIKLQNTQSESLDSP